MNQITDTARGTAVTRAQSPKRHAMITINPRSDSYRDEVIALAVDLKPTHWVNLNLHRTATLETAVKNLKRWRVEILRRLFGRRFFELPDAELVQFVGCPERTLSGQPHFHLACRVPPAVSAKFVRLAEERWKAIVPSGSSHIVDMDSRPENVQRVMSYATKYLHPNSAEPFVHSQLFH